MEAIILAGGKAERLGDAARGRPKALVPSRAIRSPAYQVAQLGGAGVDRVIVSCAAGQGALFEAGARRARARRSSPSRSRSRSAAAAGFASPPQRREESGRVFALNGDELLDVDLARALDAHDEHGARRDDHRLAAASPFGVVELDDDDRVTGFREAPLPAALGQLPASTSSTTRRSRALPERGDHEHDDIPRARGGGQAARVPPRGLLDHRQHAEGPASARGALRGASGAAVRRWQYAADGSPA